jgi:hypothetical protein
MLIQNDFLKVLGAEKWLFFEAFGAPIRSGLSTMNATVFYRHGTAMRDVQSGPSCMRPRLGF